MGSEVYVHFDLGDVAMSTRVPADKIGDIDRRERGSALSLHLQMDRCHLFEADEGGATLLPRA
jgi:hypothetical protein